LRVLFFDSDHPCIQKKEPFEWTVNGRFIRLGATDVLASAIMTIDVCSEMIRAVVKKEEQRNGSYHAITTVELQTTSNWVVAARVNGNNNSTFFQSTPFPSKEEAEAARHELLLVLHSK
jgi:hypothetical protein